MTWRESKKKIKINWAVTILGIAECTAIPGRGAEPLLKPKCQTELQLGSFGQV